MNTDKVKNIWDKIKALVKKVSKKVWVIAGAVALLLIALLVVLSIRGSRSYSMLFTGLGSSDVSGILSCFNEWGVTDYQLQGDTILVRPNVENSLRARLLEEGYPSQGFSYSPKYSEQVGALSTESERNAAAKMDLENKLAATIACFDNVRDATVTINPGSDNTYILDSNNIQAASATVTVMMADNKTLTAGQVNAIRNYVAYSVEGMQMDTSAVAIGDTMGNTYNVTANTSSDADASTLKLLLEEQYSNKIRTQVVQALINLYGQENLDVSVNCVVEVGVSTIDDHTVHLPGYAEGGETLGAGIIGSIIWNATLSVDEDGTVGGVVGTSTNSDLNTYVEQLINDSEGLRELILSGQADMNNSTTDTHTVTTAAYLKDCSVAVTINSTTAGLVDTDRVQDHVAKAAGISPVVTETMTAEEYLDSKISVMAEPFYEEPAAVGPGTESSSDGLFMGIPIWILLAAAGGLLLFVILLVVILLILKKKKKKKLQKQMEEEEKTAALLESVGIPAPDEMTGADVMTLQTDRSIELRQDIRKFVDENPEVAAQLVKGWLRGDDNDG